MKNTFLLLLLIAFTLIACNKSESLTEYQFESTGMILGSDKSFCMCCGGWILQIDGDENAYRIEQLPADSGIELSEESLNVKFDWSINRECGSIIYVDIEAIELN